MHRIRLDGGGEVEVVEAPLKDPPSVSPGGVRLVATIDGVVLRRVLVQEDERGWVAEIMSTQWDFSPDPIEYVYMVAIRPGSVKGWVMHLAQDDRAFFADGSMAVSLYDARVGSPTQGASAVHHVGTRNPSLLLIPKGVFHAVRNVGTKDAVFVNLPTRAYRHDDPDKYRLPTTTKAIPIQP